MTNPTHIVVLFDGEHPNDRAELLAEYKANRTDYSTVPEEESPFSQLQDVYDALTFILLQRYEMIGFLISAKSIFRLNPSNNNFSRKNIEYILLGTMMSFLVAIIIGLFTNYVLYLICSMTRLSLV